MVLGIERINARRRPPNPLINFLTPLNPNDATALDRLERVAAMVYPIMKEHQLVVMNVDEFPPNREFWGRNFNAGATIQLVLRSPTTGRWLPLRFVFGVMIHELAHNVQMNHSSAFWKVQHGFNAHLHRLYAADYTGEGFWGKGRTLEGGDVEEVKTESELEGVGVCGGVYKERKRRKRKEKTKETKEMREERKRRRIEKKFGSAEGKKVGGGEEGAPKPRVAKSQRGRELRAAAALRRFEDQKKVKEEEVEDESGQETADEEDEKVEGEIEGKDGKRMVPAGKGEDAEDVGREMEEEMKALLGGCCGEGRKGKGRDVVTLAVSDDEGEATADEEDQAPQVGPPLKKSEPLKETSSTPIATAARKPPPSSKTSKSTPQPKSSLPLSTAPSAAASPLPPTRPHSPPPSLSTPPPRTSSSSIATNTTSCPVCTTTNSPTSETCITCLNVLNPSQHPNAWQCGTLQCSKQYWNTPDVVYCGACGERRKDDGREKVKVKEGSKGVEGWKWA